MARYQYFESGSLRSFSTLSLAKAEAATSRGRGRARGATGSPHASSALHAGKRFETRFQTISETSTFAALQPKTGGITIATETIAIDGARAPELRWLRDQYGFEIVSEGLHGKVLVRAPEGGAKGVKAAFDGAQALFRRGKVGAAHPNFIRAFRHMQRKASAVGQQWNLSNPGDPGVVGADVHALAVWTITRGIPDIRVAVLDEGIDSLHPDLKSAIVAEHDVVGGNKHARPDGDDAHGTACAGIIGSRSNAVRGLASGVSLVGVRIAKGDGTPNGWIFDDFDTADAIDWAWDVGQADVLSNSWGGGPPVDVITRAFDRARTRGRGGRGAVVVLASGNDAGAVSYPATLSFVLSVGASNQWDEQKTPTSKDRERWGSNFGPELDLVAPGVQILTTDISGPRGYTQGNVVSDFNGTSAATPHVAAAAALILSERPKLTEGRVRQLLKQNADRLAKKGIRDNRTGYGRLNCYKSLWRARR